MIEDLAKVANSDAAAARKLVLDTNVWLDWLVFNDPSTQWLDQAERADPFQLLATAHTRDEFLSVLPRTAIVKRLPQPRQRQEVAWRFESMLTLTGQPNRGLLTCTDPDDQVFIDLALAHQAQALVTRDKAVLALAKRAGKRYGLQIVTPNEYSTTYLK